MCQHIPMGLACLLVPHAECLSVNLYLLIVNIYLTSQAGPFNLLERIHANLGHPRTLLERTGLSDSNIMLMANASCSYHILWQCTLSERPLWLLVLLVIKQFTAPNFPQIMLDCVANKANCKARSDEWLHVRHAVVSNKL